MAMNFGEAIEVMKDGEKVARKGWNGKGMFIYLVKGTAIPYTDLKDNEARMALVRTSDNGKGTVVFNSHIDMKAADGSITVGWAPSQVDMLAEDWDFVDA